MRVNSIEHNIRLAMAAYEAGATPLDYLHVALEELDKLAAKKKTTVKK